ncbi:MAG: hypothetical protein PSN34_06465 [Urechidicola sp.]|nr:hypothetical protein [Urechidicola sp.]
MLNIYSKLGLEEKIAELNNWLNHHTAAHYNYARKERNRNYYVGKLIELEETNSTVIRA